MTRNEAIEKLKSPAYDPETIHHDFEYVASKLDMSIGDLQSCFDLPNKTFRDYRNQSTLYNVGARALKLLQKELGGKR